MPYMKCSRAETSFGNTAVEVMHAARMPASGSFGKLMGWPKSSPTRSPVCGLVLPENRTTQAPCELARHWGRPRWRTRLLRRPGWLLLCVRRPSGSLWPVTRTPTP